jgi:hypothetical protein
VSATPAARYLVHFGRGDDGASAMQASARESGTPQASPQSVDFKRLVDAAARAAREEARAAIAAEYEERLAAERRAHEEALSAARARWCAEEGERLAPMLAAGIEGLETRIADTAAGVLRPFVDAMRRAQVIGALREAVTAVLASDAPALRIEGPQALLDALRAALPDTGGTLVDYVPSERVDVRVVADRTVITSHLEAWGRRVDEGAA